MLCFCHHLMHPYCIKAFSILSPHFEWKWITVLQKIWASLIGHLIRFTYSTCLSNILTSQSHGSMHLGILRWINMICCSNLASEWGIMAFECVMVVGDREASLSISETADLLGVCMQIHILDLKRTARNRDNIQWAVVIENNNNTNKNKVLLMPEFRIEWPGWVQPGIGVPIKVSICLRINFGAPIQMWVKSD